MLEVYVRLLPVFEHLIDGGVWLGSIADHASAAKGGTCAA
jgi:hypothetical protein